MGKYRDGTFVTRGIRIVVNQFVKIGRRRHGVQQQDKTDQQGGKNCLAVALEMSDSVLQGFAF